MCIVLEFMYHGDLKGYLQKHRPHQEVKTHHLIIVKVFLSKSSLKAL
jgi:hypothetical protein